jgi:integrase
VLAFRAVVILTSTVLRSPVPVPNRPQERGRLHLRSRAARHCQFAGVATVIFLTLYTSPSWSPRTWWRATPWPRCASLAASTGHPGHPRSDAAARLLATAAQRDRRGRNPWPERDLALVGTFCVTGIREGEAVALTMGSLEGTPGARRLQVVGKGGKTRAIPVEGGLEEVLEAYLATRRAHFEDHDLDHPPLPCSSTSVAAGCRWTRSST